MPAVNSFTINCDAVNEEGTFSQGDTVTGQVILSLSKETKAQRLFVKAKGDANVRWTQKRGEHTHTYSAHRRYFKLKEFLIPEGTEETVLPEGTHVYKFSFRIPSENMPSSFRGSHGKIVYKLEAKLSRSWRMDSTAEKELNFVSKSFPNFNALLSPQVGSTEKEMGMFSKGQVHMDATVNKTLYAPGETILISTKVNNASSRDMTPKFSLVRSVQFRAQGDTKNEEYTVEKVADKVMKPHTQQEVKCEMKIPTDEMLSIENCEIISVTHQLKAYLDISFAFDPEIIFPVLISHPTLVFGANNSGPVGPYPVAAFGGPANSDFLPPAMAVGPYPAPPFSGPYGYPGAQSPSAPPPAYPSNPQAYYGPPGPYGPQPPPIYGAHSNPVPQGPSPYGSPFSPSSSSTMLHPPPPAPMFDVPPSGPQVQPPFSSVSPSAPTFNPMPSAPDMTTDFLSQTNDAPPAYTSLFPSSTPEKSDTK
ncbi:arrestin domain-containing protein 3-like [Poecilia reticulata]|uniref:arrestin domain-containing protein 3-like n=1 Tax=Poecilia reticulata TaxID=8081 RepID=UPI0007EA26D8|nr:PREDICTED: arrestin domain-containing protein 3-like [Poecilia reticulata]